MSLFIVGRKVWLRKDGRIITQQAAKWERRHNPENVVGKCEVVKYRGYWYGCKAGSCLFGPRGNGIYECCFCGARIKLISPSSK